MTIVGCANDDLSFNTIPKGRASTVLGNAQLELSGIEHRRRRGLYDRHLVGQALSKRQHSIESIAKAMIEDWERPDAKGIIEEGKTRAVELGAAFCNEFPVRVVSSVLGLPKEAQAQFLYWYQSMMAGFGGSDTAKQGLQARQDLRITSKALSSNEERNRPFSTIARERLRARISFLCFAELVSTMIFSQPKRSLYNSFVGGRRGDTTRGAIMNMWYLLLLHPQQLDAIKTMIIYGSQHFRKHSGTQFRWRLATKAHNIRS